MKKILAAFALCILGSTALSANQSSLEAKELIFLGGGCNSELCDSNIVSKCDPAICGTNGLEIKLLDNIIKPAIKGETVIAPKCDPAICGTNGLEIKLLDNAVKPAIKSETDVVSKCDPVLCGSNGLNPKLL